MKQSDVDKLLKRKLYLQRYVTSLFNDIKDANEGGDTRLLNEIMTFILNADESTLQALSRARTSNKDVRSFLSTVTTIMREQHATTLALFNEQMPELIEQEAEVTASVVGIDTPSTTGVFSLPIAGLAISAIIATDFAKYQNRVRAEIIQGAGTNPSGIASVVRGTKSQRWRDGVLWWRDNRVLKISADRIVNSVAGNTAERVYQAAKVEWVDHIATLDFRTCPSCIAAEMNSPYRLGSQPRIQLHPNCRCLNMPHTPDRADPERPYVEDDRSVKNIPKSERAGKIGKTRDTIGEFFNRMTDEERIDYMGPTRARLWREGKIDDMRDLVNSRTLKPLRLDQLPK